MSTIAQSSTPLEIESARRLSNPAALGGDEPRKITTERKASPCVISESSVGAELDEADCEVLAKIMDVRSLHDNEVLVREGDADSSLFILASGNLAVANGKARKSETVVHLMAPGECAGTRAFVDRAKRRATLRAKGDVTVYALQPEPFEALLQGHALLVYKVMRALFRTTHRNLMRMNMESRELTNYITKSGGRY